MKTIISILKNEKPIKVENIFKCRFIYSVLILLTLLFIVVTNLILKKIIIIKTTWLFES